MTDLKHIYLVRHGQSRHNADHLLGVSESPLTQKGIKQSQALAEHFLKLPIDIVLSSNLKRALQTGQIIAEKNNVPLEILDMIYERIFPEEIRGLHQDDPFVQERIKKFEYDWIHKRSEEHTSELQSH